MEKKKPAKRRRQYPPEAYEKCSTRLREETRKKLKIAAALSGQDEYELTDEVLTEHFKTLKIKL